MTNEEASIIIGNIPINGDGCYSIPEYQQAKAKAIEALEQQPCEDVVSRQAVLDSFWKLDIELRPCAIDAIVNMINNLPSVAPKEKTGRCKDCKWWKDNDGVYRRGIGAESKCPINCKKVYEGNGYCFMFEPQESEDKE